MISKQNPIALLTVLRDRAMGFFLKQTPILAPTQVVGVDIGHSYLLILAVEKNLEEMEISHFRLEPRPNTPEGVSERLKTIFMEEGLPPKGIRTALKSKGMVIRILNFPQMKRSEIASMLQFEVEKYIPFKTSEAILDFQVLTEDIPRGGAKTMELLLVAAKQTDVRQLLDLFLKSGLEVETIDVGAFAISNLLEFAFPETRTNPVAFLDMGGESSIFGILLHGKPIFIRDISFGGGDLLKLLKRKLTLEPGATLSPPEHPSRASPQYKTAVEQALAGLLNELKLSLGYYLDHVQGAEPVQTLFIFGGGCRFIPDFGYIEREIRIPTRRPDFFSRVKINPRLDEELLRKNEDLIPAALGLCLR